MNRRLFIFVITLFCCVGVLLLLSAVIQTTETDIAAAEEPPTAHTISAFVSMPPSPTSASVTLFSGWLRIAALFAAAAVLLPRLQCTCDANGRVLCKRRYVHSFHLVFKQDVACG